MEDWQMKQNKHPALSTFKYRAGPSASSVRFLTGQNLTNDQYTVPHILKIVVSALFPITTSNLTSHYMLAMV
jgi:hypothetical protein